MKTKTLYILLFFIAFATSSFAQEMRRVSGVLKDSTGKAIIGATIAEEGNANNGTITDIDGYYQLNVPLGSTINVTYLGMKPKEMKVTTSNSESIGGQKILDLKEEETSKNADSEESKEEPKQGGRKVIKPQIDQSDTDKSLSPYFLVIANDLEKASLPLKNTDVEVNIAGVIADVSVKQTYINDGDDTLEAIYVFPGSTRAAVYAMSMTVGEKKIDAQIKKKEQARQEYEVAKEEGKSASLLEQHRPNVFQMNVANILPGDTIVVEMRYTELLENLDAQYEFVYPTVVGPRFTQGGEEWVTRSTVDDLLDQRPQFSIKTIIQAGMPIQKVSSPSHSLSIEHTTPDQVIASLSNPKDDQGNKDYILHYELQGGQVQSGLLRYEHGDENFFLLMMQPPKSPTLDQIPPREYIFILDVSGSMWGFPIELSKNLMRKLTANLRPIDRFNVILFESGNDMLYETSVPATEENLNKAMEVINNQQGSGWTNLYPTLQKAMDLEGVDGYSRTFLILTDGYVTIEKEAFQYIRNHLGEANLFPFGIGSSVNRYMIEGLANAGMGDPYIITNNTEAEEIGDKAIKKISEPVLTKINIDWDEFDVYDVEPVAVPDVFAQRPILVYGKYRGEAKGSVTVSGIAGDKKYQQIFDVKQARQEHNQALRYLWARNKIRYYDDFAQYYEGNNNYANSYKSPQQIETVTNLGLKYNLLTQYTSFLAVEDVVRIPQQNKGITIGSSIPASSLTSSMILEDDNQSLDDVVVVGYGVSKKKTLAYSARSVSDSEIGMSLQGKVSGLQITETSGDPGSTPKISIRGASSIMDNNTPVVVLDGVVTDYSAIQSIAPTSIETINILKDASATTLYGSRAANGVIILETKKASKKSKLVFSNSISLDMPTKLSKMQNTYAQGRPVDGVSQWNKTNEAFSWGPKVSEIGAPTYDALDFLQNGYTLKNTLSYQGKLKNEKYNYGISLGNITQEGFIPGSRLQDNTIGLKFGKVNNYDKGIEFDVDLKYNHNDGNRLQRGYNMSSFMYGILTTPPTFDNQNVYSADGMQNRAGSMADNPYWTKQNNPFSDKRDRLLANLNVKYKVDSKLSISVQANDEYLSASAKNNLNIGSAYIPAGHIMNRKEDFNRFQAKAFGSYNTYFDRWNLNAILGYEYNNSRRSINRKDGYDLSVKNDYNLSNAEKINRFDRKYKRSSNATFAQVKLDYDRNYFLESGLRTEWSSINNKALISPTVGIGANFQDIFRLDWLNYLKVYGNFTSTDRELPLYTDPTYFNTAAYSLNDAASHFENREIMVSKDLKPEKVNHVEFGFESRILNSRYGLSASIYKKEGRNQFLPTDITESTVYLENAGKIRNQGLEITADAYVIENYNFRWNARLIYNIERSKVSGLGDRKFMLAGIDGVVGSYAIDGQPLGVLYGTTYQRNEDGNMIIGEDGFPLVAEKQAIIGDPNPKWRMSLINTFSFNRFNLSATLEYKHGGKIWNGTQNAMSYYGTSQESASLRNTTGYIFDGVMADGSVNTIPVNFYGNNLSENRWVRYGEYGVSEDAIQDASFLKIREILLSYKLPLRGYRGSNIKFSIFATNILLFSKAKGIDPETNMTGSSNGFGLSYFNIPSATTTGFSVTFEF